MADEQVRHLERQAAGGDPEATTRLLRERMRSGDLARERVELAAWVGDEAALAALGVASTTAHLGDWAAGLERFGHHVGLRAVVEMAACGATLLEPGTRDTRIVRTLVQRARALTEHPQRLGAELMVSEFPDERGPLWQAILAGVRTANARPYYLDQADPEVLRAYAEHFPRRHPHPDTGERWTYTHTALNRRRWIHHFDHRRHPVSGFPTHNTFPASPTWKPTGETPPHPVMRCGLLGDCLVELANVVVRMGGEVEEAVAVALVPWALR